MPTPYASPAATECTAALPAWLAPAAGQCTAVFGSDTRWQIVRAQSAEPANGYGEPSARNAQEFVRPEGFLDEEVGPAAYPAQGVSAQMLERSPVPAQRVTTGAVYLGAPAVHIPTPPEQYLLADPLDSAIFAEPQIDWLTFLVRADGFFDDGIAPHAPPATRVTARLLDGYQAPPSTRATAQLPVPGAPVVARYFAPATQHTSPYGEDQSAFGRAGIVFDQFVFPRPFYPPLLSQPTVENFFRELLAMGWSEHSVGGGTKAFNKNRPIQHGGSDFMDFRHVGIPGDPSSSQRLEVWFWNRHVAPPGFTQHTSGTPWASHHLRYLELANKSHDSLMVGAHWVSRSPRIIEQDSRFDFPPTIVSSHVVGGTRFLLAQGSDMARFGTRIVPQAQIINPQGFAGEHGLPLVELWTRYVRPDGFETIHTELRFGQHDIWNLRQYIHHAVIPEDPDDHLNPPKIEDRARVANRNREQAPPGWRSDAFGYTTIINAARAVLPFGAPAPEPEPFTPYGYVTHWLQPAEPDGTEAMVFGRWLTVYNGARVIRGATAGDALRFGTHGLRNLNREFQDIGRLDSAVLGYPFVADAVRELTFDPRYAILPPYNAGHEVKLYTRWVRDASAGETWRTGAVWLRIHWTLIKAAWGAFHAPDYVGMAALHNVTPELRQRGHLSEVIGQAAVRNEWEAYRIEGEDMAWFGRPLVRDRRTWAYPFGLAPLAVMPGPVLTKFGGRPEDQLITLREGIGPTPSIQDQVPRPKLNYQFVLAEGFDTVQWGDALAHANSIRVEPGYWDHLFSDEHRVELLHRVVDLDEQGIARSEENVGEPGLSPHTIYAVVEAPAQAIRNHPYQRLHYVDHDPTTNRRLIGVGANHAISFRYRTLRSGSIPPPGWSSRTNPPRPVVMNKTQQVWPEGNMDERIGWPVIPGPQDVDQDRGGWNSPVFGRPEVGPPPYTGPLYARPAGLPSLAMGRPEVDFFHRYRAAHGFDAMQMGASLPKDTPYMWQGLRVGERVPTDISGGDQALYGEHWISLWVRTLITEGEDGATIDGYDPTNFGGRMQVRNATSPAPASRTLTPVGVAAPFIYGHSTRMGSYYIRPDGDSDQFRKNSAEFGEPAISPAP